MRGGRKLRYDGRMIGYLEGTVAAVRRGFAIVSAGGVGYKVFATRECLARLKPAEEAALWTHLAVREAVLDLYGFSTEEELRLFELLLTVSGIGPKSALAILDIATVETMRSAIGGGNAGYLTKVSGIGRKTAEKIVLELKDKVGAAAEGSAASLHGEEEALEAMRALGYSQAEARDALRTVPPEIERASDRLREALRMLGRK
jgi:Holliday junction DNA helicase RuvA